MKLCGSGGMVATNSPDGRKAPFRDGSVLGTSLKTAILRPPDAKS